MSVVCNVIHTWTLLVFAVKFPFEVCFGDKILLPYIEKSLELVLCKIQTEKNVSSLITNICFNVTNHWEMYAT